MTDTVGATSRHVLAAQLHAYFGQHDQAIALLSELLQRRRYELRALRFRGHYHILKRRPDAALSDLRRAADILGTAPDEYEYSKPFIKSLACRVMLTGRLDADIGTDLHIDGNPGSGTVDPSRFYTTLHNAVWYHLGITHYVAGRYNDAADAFGFAETSAILTAPIIAALDWQWTCLQRAGRPEQARQILDKFASLPGAEPISTPYAQLLRLYSGQLDPDTIRVAAPEDPMARTTIEYGISNWHRARGENEQAHAAVTRALATGARYAFAYVAAERDNQPRPQRR